MGIGPVFAVPKLLKRLGLSVKDIDLWELNEAFAVQVLYCADTLGIPMDKLNVNGGAIAVGHPLRHERPAPRRSRADRGKRRGNQNSFARRCVLVVAWGGGDFRGGVIANAS